MSQHELWIGHVELGDLKRGPDGAYGAYTVIVTWACDEQSFRQKVDALAARLDMFLVEIDFAEPAAERRKAPYLTMQEVHDLLNQAELNPDAILHSTFHTYGPFDA